MGLGSSELWEAVRHSPLSSLNYGRWVSNTTKRTKLCSLLPVTMAPKKRPTPTWVESTPAPPKAKVPKVTELNKLTSSESRGILFTVEGIDPKHFDTLATKNFSSWEDVRTTLGVEPAVIVRLQDKLADRPEVKGWIEKPDDFPAESSQPATAV